MRNVSSPDMSDAGIERVIQAKGLTAPRVTKDEIDALMARVTFTGGRVGETTSTIVHAFLDGTFLLASGHSACVSASNYNTDLGYSMARVQAEAKARDQLWLLEGYALRKRLAAVPADFRDRVRLERDELQVKFDALVSFAKTEGFVALASSEQDRLLAQAACMSEYLGVLKERIAAFDAA